MRDPERESNTIAMTANIREDASVGAVRRANWVEDLSFEALLQDEVIRLVMASDRVSESELRTLRHIHPLIS